jgi:hypothetical protein
MGPGDGLFFQGVKLTNDGDGRNEVYIADLPHRGVRCLVDTNTMMRGELFRESVDGD